MIEKGEAIHPFFIAENLHTTEFLFTISLQTKSSGKDYQPIRNDEYLLHRSGASNI